MRRSPFLGLIPARAGTTHAPSASRHRLRAHPRSRGDHLPNFCARWMRKGSSPLARGPHGYGKSSISGLGLIPARAGTTLRKQAVRSSEAAHPRSRGDHSRLSASTSLCSGSSPLARGPLTPLASPPRFPGLIPARAGTTDACPCLGFLSRAHPRSRGDHTASARANSSGLGSSPLARGPRFSPRK